MALLWSGLKSLFSQKVQTVSATWENKKKEKELENGPIYIRRIFCWNKHDLSSPPELYLNDKILKQKYNFRERTTFYLKDLPYKDTLLEVHYEMCKETYSVIYTSDTIVFPPLDTKSKFENKNQITSNSLKKSVYQNLVHCEGQSYLSETDITNWIKKYEGEFHAFHLVPSNHKSASLEDIFDIIYMICSCYPEDTEKAFAIHFGYDSDFQTLRELMYKNSNGNFKGISPIGLLSSNLWCSTITNTPKETKQKRSKINTKEIDSTKENGDLIL